MMYSALESRQGMQCAICHRTLPLVIDHDHACCPGKRSCGRCIRGLLCDLCNRGLGMFKDDPIRLRAAAEYLASER